MSRRVDLPLPERTLPGRSEAMPISDAHFVTGRSISEVPPGHRQVSFGMGCFWGAERKFWSLDGVFSTAVGYAGGGTPNPTYKEVCSGHTGHTEVVRVVFDPTKVSLKQLLAVFWESHDPTQGMRQGNDVGTQYRSAVFVEDAEQLKLVETSQQAYAQQLEKAGFGPVTTEIATGVPFYFAEDYHQQYLAKNPNGYCGLGGTGVKCTL